MTQYTIGHKFNNDYHPDAAEWCMQHGAMIVADVNGGYEIQAVPTPTAEQQMETLRNARDNRIDATDKYLLADYPISAENLTAVKAYRQALRDLPAQSGAPWDGGGELTPWPDLPSV